MKPLLRLALGSLGLSLLTLGGLLTAHSPMTGAGPPPLQPADPWPQFVMTYKNEVYDWQTGQVTAADTYRYTYQGWKNWQLDLVASTRDPRAVGTWSRYDGTAFTSASVIDGQPLPEQRAPADHLVMATWWLVPVSPAQLGADGRFQRVGLDGATIHLQQHAAHSCASLPAQGLTAMCQPGQQTYQSSTDRVLTADRGIPVEITERAESKIVSRIAVTAVSYK